MGRAKNNQLESSLDESFESIEIEAEYKKIELHRDWIDLNLF